MSNLINIDTINEWQNGGYVRKIRPVTDISAMLQNNRRDFLQIIRIYINYAIIVTGNHIDYQRNTCDHLIDNDSPFANLFENAFQLNYGTDEPFDINMLDIDHLADFIQTQDDSLIEFFTWHYLMALRQVNHVEQPDDFVENFNEVISELFIALMLQLKESR